MTNLNWTPLHQHSWYSLLDGLSNPDKMASRCKELGYTAAAITDHGSLSGCVNFFQACRKEGIKPILGCELYICEKDATFKNAENKELTHAVILAKNLEGWHELVRCVSDSYLPEHFYFKPRVGLNMMKKYLGNDNHVCIIGHPGTKLANSLFTSNEVYDCRNIEEALPFLREDWRVKAEEVIDQYYGTFKDNLFIEIQLIDQDCLPAAKIIADCLRQIVAARPELRPVATADSHYVNKSDAELQRILICSSIGRTMSGIARDLSQGEKVPMSTFFVSDNYHIPSLEEICAVNLAPEIYNTQVINDMCEDYDILSAPQLPKFDCPNGEDEFEYLMQLCRDGWRNRLIPTGAVRSKEQKDLYEARIREELEVIHEANLSGYFLIVYDIINYCRSKGWLPGVGRGSAAGCLISYLIGITGIDPIPFGLLFSRFYNSSRKGSLPDIDMDVPADHREEVIEYIKDKYGAQYVSQMATFGCLMGRSAIKEVLRICTDTTFAEMNDITEYIPDEAAIADELEATGETSVIRWALTYRSGRFSRWVKLEEDGTLTGDMAEFFSKAIALEGTPKSMGKHAAGLIISAKPLRDCVPMVRVKDGGEPVAGWDMHAMEATGHVKLDVLGIDLLSKVAEVSEHGNLNIDNFDDKATWDMLSAGDVKGVFQLERQSRWTKKLKPQNIEHLSALVAIIRPGVSEAMLEGKSMTEHYIDRKNGLEEPTYIHESLRPILQDTYGVIIYQEQAMRIARELAGFSLNEADLLRKAMGKKNTTLMAKVKGDFIEGCKTQGIVDEATAASIFDWIEKAQRYSFNKCLSPSTIVETRDGLQILDELKVGDFVKAPGNKFVEVTDKIEQGVQEVYEVTLESGKTIECTLNHKFLCDNGETLPLWEILDKNIKIMCEEE